MDAGSGLNTADCCKLQLSADERCFYEELFLNFDNGGDGRIQGSQASALLRAANLPTDTLQQITELSGAKRVGHFGRTQFYRALKLIAGAQNGMKPSNEVLAAPLPLPKLSNLSHHTSIIINNNNIVSCYNSAAQAQDSSPDESQQTTSPKDRTWTTFQRTENDWSSSRMLQLQAEEQCHLLGGAADEDDDEDTAGIWSITKEQRAYYAEQFQKMQTDLTRGKIQGQQAKEFFEKSRLPVEELSRIWQLSDIDRDGQLALDEFCTAMHLVVLRKNGIELPSQLPATLLPDIPPLIQTSPLPTNSHINQSTGTKGQAVKVSTPMSKQWMKFSPSPITGSQSHSESSRKPNPHIQRTPSSEVGTGPVSFDFSTTLVNQDPRILHPVARRISPDPPSTFNNNCDPPTRSVADPSGGSGYVIMNNSGDNDTLDGTQMINSNGPFSTPSLDAISNGTRTPLAAKKDAPPPPPPRPAHRGHHARSSSLDLNLRTNPQKSLFPPVVPPRSSPANGSNVPRSLSREEGLKALGNNPPRIGATGGGAFQVYSGAVKKPDDKRVSADEESSCSSSHSSSSSSCNSSYEDLSLDPTTDDAAMLLVDDDHTEFGFMESSHRAARKLELPDAMMAQFMTEIPTDREQLIREIGAHRERNSMLREWNKNLHDELQLLVQERLSLQNQKQPTSTI
ncbi:ralBP1-associated Eps domain-containing protein 1 [Galendromus occidentalis]|uniref:RalBP1-associated Eps domain-containing protein 1 n=1 Tax=Galendromus occidentalis TaxID=34638 RepID=A0AAJ6VX21_9ACAR|nr:ralBP1-associated Eps domain-containing protein 1 [Galendromus occidentalis]